MSIRSFEKRLTWDSIFKARLRLRISSIKKPISKLKTVSVLYRKMRKATINVLKEFRQKSTTQEETIFSQFRNFSSKFKTKSDQRLSAFESKTSHESVGL